MFYSLSFALLRHFISVHMHFTLTLIRTHTNDCNEQTTTKNTILYFNRNKNIPVVCKQLAIVSSTWTCIDKTHKLLTLFLFYVHASAAICLKIQQQHKATRIVRTRLYRSTLFLFMAKLGMFIVSNACDISKRRCYRKLQLQFKLTI